MIIIWYILPFCHLLSDAFCYHWAGIFLCLRACALFLVGSLDCLVLTEVESTPEWCLNRFLNMHKESNMGIQVQTWSALISCCLQYIAFLHTHLQHFYSIGSVYFAVTSGTWLLPCAMTQIQKKISASHLILWLSLLDWQKEVQESDIIAWSVNTTTSTYVEEASTIITLAT